MASNFAPGNHAEQMDLTYAFQRHIYDLTRKYYLLGRDDLIRQMRPQVGHHVLEIGCGTARNLVLSARAYPGAKLYGIDISAEMLKSARRKLAAKKLESRIRLYRADATAFNPASVFRQKLFDRIFFSYTLSMIPDWRAAIRNAAGILAPGGELHIIDFGMQQDLPRWFGEMLGAWLARFHVTRREGLSDFCAALSAEHEFEFQSRSRSGEYAQIIVIRRPSS